MTPGNSSIIRICIFASGNGSNAKKIVEYFSSKAGYKVSLIVCNKPGAGVLNIAAQNNIPALLIEKEKFFQGNSYVDELKAEKIDFIVLAGFLWKVPAALINAFPASIVNIHPALLPKYGGKGMYGKKVHETVIANCETESGITIHWVDEKYDHGSILFQAKCPVFLHDNPETLAARVHLLEHEHYPQVIENLLKKLRQ